MRTRGTLVRTSMKMLLSKVSVIAVGESRRGSEDQRNAPFVTKLNLDLLNSLGSPALLILLL
jgi:hypothetical protein